MGGSKRSWFSRHPVLALLALNFLIFAVLAGIAEVGLRLFMSYNPGFYTSVRATDTELTHPYGIIKINSHGFPDEEWALSKPRRIGYFGDSVTYGVGAGYPYRISEIVEAAYPEYEHLNLGGIGLSVSNAEIANAVKLARRFGLTDAIYLFNLNDILPDQAFSGELRPTSLRMRDQIVDHLDWLRGRSYLYTFLRTQAKNLLRRHGVGFHGYSAYEFEPRKHEQILRETAGRINHFYEVMAEHGVRLTVVILPYEMQISQEAAAKYAELGIAWEDGFIDRGAQRVIVPFFDEALPVVDAYWAFIDDATDPDRSRVKNGLGEYFVYNKGDKLDWNHPNRAGHRRIGEYLAREDILARTGQERAAGTPPGAGAPDQAAGLTHSSTSR